MSPLARPARAPDPGAFFVSGAFLKYLMLLVLLTEIGSAAAVAHPCPPDRIDETTRVAYVHDGDTVVLADGRKLRIVGLNAPELGRDGSPPEEFALRARDTLRSLLASGHEIGLRLDQQRQDRYGRLLAHVFLDNNVNVAARLLAQGYGTTLVVPPNLWHETCYRAAEREARERARGIWMLPAYQHTDAAALDIDASGYKILRGRVSRLAVGGNSVRLYLDGNVVVRIHSNDVGYFKPLTFDTGSGYWAGRNIEARGWVHRYQDRVYMQIRHPAALTIVDGP